MFGKELFVIIKGIKDNILRLQNIYKYRDCLGKNSY
jgi:hypothetical protein